MDGGPRCLACSFYSNNNKIESRRNGIHQASVRPSVRPSDRPFVRSFVRSSCNCLILFTRSLLSRVFVEFILFLSARLEMGRGAFHSNLVM